MELVFPRPTDLEGGSCTLQPGALGHCVASDAADSPSGSQKKLAGRHRDCLAAEFQWARHRFRSEITIC